MLIVYSANGILEGMCTRYGDFTPNEDETLVLADKFPLGSRADVVFLVDGSDCYTDHGWLDALVQREEARNRMVATALNRRALHDQFQAIVDDRR